MAAFCATVWRTSRSDRPSRRSTIQMSLPQEPFTLRVKRLSESALLPRRATEESAGYDLFSAEDAEVQPGHRKLVATGIALCIPAGCYGRVAPRSGLAVRHGIHVGAGVIDADYRGSVGILLFNFGQKVFCVRTGDRIAQLIIEKIALPEVIETDDLESSVRGDGGFGSTGLS
eukprot:Plantae.Rhodophyta-Purpureofilum_apyrenoidigerum.ctg46445.p1 GENE.Plantae.Rhodophyta-Purpureofilum_apyrenoidigerum.ctg46445~~Plantae.Rhodophyta-Purpureofilum_apyrenoidigerum.ctg46445.p1  ORF type:complete len:183 (+),score=24.70 Plantae.Rhodophyta-Purpureofilum_apyrenoidigerum.ctg46445:31-549(+)